MDIISYIAANPPDGWNECFNYCYPEFKEASDKLYIESLNNIIFPFYNEIFSVFYLLKPENIKVLILGKDPYQGIIKNTEYLNGGIPISNGIAFSCRKEAPIQPSLRNIFKEVKDNYLDVTFSSGDLTPWVNQGVFLLNKCLTVNKDKTGSHKDMWDKFINKVIYYLQYKNPNIIYVLWGNDAQSLQLSQNSIKIIGGHPSPMNASGNFLGGRYFIRINEILRYQGKQEISWST